MDEGGIKLEERQKKRRRAVVYLMLFVVSLAFYLVWYLLDGIILTEDAPSYINMQSDREPGYCLYLWMFRGMFGEAWYLHAAVVVQCIPFFLPLLQLNSSLVHAMRCLSHPPQPSPGYGNDRFPCQMLPHVSLRHPDSAGTCLHLQAALPAPVQTFSPPP